jgi:hypothetical protein
MSAQTLLAISQAIWRQFAPVAEKNRYSALNICSRSTAALSIGREQTLRFTPQMLQDISQEIRRQYPIKGYDGFSAKNDCVLMNQDLYHLHVYWRDPVIKPTTITAPWVVKVVSSFDAEQQPLEYFYRPSTQQLQKQQMTITLPTQAINAVHQVVIGHFNHNDNFQPRLESNFSGIKIMRVDVGEPLMEGWGIRSGSGLIA